MLWVTRIGQGPFNFGCYSRWKWPLTPYELRREKIFWQISKKGDYILRQKNTIFSRSPEPIKGKVCMGNVFKWTMSQAPKTRIGIFCPIHSRFSMRALHLLMMQKEQKLLWPSLRSLCISRSRNPKRSKNILSPTKFFRHLDPRGPTFSFPFSLPKPTLAAKTFFIVAK